MHKMIIELRSLGNLIAECWNEAERATANSVHEKYHSPDEENITFLFSGELRNMVRKASDDGHVSNAFLDDLRRGVHNLRSDDLRGYAGLVARVNFHNKQHEGRKSASDLGIAIRRPQLRVDSSHLTLSLELGIGMLAQAKLARSCDTRKSVHHWKLTTAQKKLLPKRKDYYSLLLYRLSGNDSNELNDFKWQLCKGYTLAQVQDWLKSGSFPKEQSSTEIIRALFANKIGTTDPKLIAEIIDPNASSAQAIELQVFWPKGRKPPSTSRLVLPVSTHVVRQLL